MALTQVNCMYGHLEGMDGKFARDITGYLSIEAGIYEKHGLEVSWNHVQGTEERYRKLESGDAQISFVVGRASLQHFLDTKSTRVLGCAMNTCPYLLVTDASIREIKGLKGQTVVCREGPARGVPLHSIFQQLGGITMGEDFELKLVGSDQEAFHMLLGGNAAAALLPRPYGFIAEDRNFHRLVEWPDIVDDPLPITMETTQNLLEGRGNIFRTFLTAHREGIGYAKANRERVVRLLIEKFGHRRSLAERTFADYIGYMDESLLIDMLQMAKLLDQLAPNGNLNARQIASGWAMPGAVKT